MRAHLLRPIVALVMVVCAWLCNPSAKAQAHPQLAGDWVSPTPAGGFQVFHFGLGRHLGNGLWHGRCSINVSNCSIVFGAYVLNMIDDHQATLVPLRNTTNLSPTVGIVDLSTGVLTLKNVTYRRRGGNPMIPNATLVVPSGLPNPVPAVPSVIPNPVPVVP